ncbi:MAG TPA: hypothetical protein VFE09_05560 [Rubrobacteraceae bacterium]|nr:hypothetical protein [Rubrobacteraceae bacterium]
MKAEIAGDGEFHQLELNLHPNEASGLLTVENEPLLEAHDWEIARWAVLDEGEIEDCVAIVGHRRGADISEGWDIDRLHAVPAGDAAETEDAESVARRDGWVYIFGSHFGSKSGPLQPERQFVARFREADVGHATEDPAVDIEIFRESFVLHRLINDALKPHGPETIPLGPESYEAFIKETRRHGAEDLVHDDDLPLNFEGAAFRADGSLLLGLRFPVAAAGRPILVELEGVERLFEPGDRLPEVKGFWVVNAVGRNGDMAGVRDLAIVHTANGEELHLVTGNIDSRDKQSVLIRDYPGGRDTVATHFRCTLPPDAHTGSLEAGFVREFPTLPRVEGIAITEDGRFFYVTDEDEGVHLRLTRLLAG